MSERAAKLLTEILDRFTALDAVPGEDWAFCDDYTEMGLDCLLSDGSKFWLDLTKEGRITVMWKPSGGVARQMTFSDVDIKSDAGGENVR